MFYPDGAQADCMQEEWVSASGLLIQTILYVRIIKMEYINYLGRKIRSKYVIRYDFREFVKFNLSRVLCLSPYYFKTQLFRRKL